MTDRDWSPRVDRKFLQRLFKDNGASCGIRVFGSPPDYVSTSIKSFPYLVDLFVAGFDAAGQECWRGYFSSVSMRGKKRMRTQALHW